MAPAAAEGAADTVLPPGAQCRAGPVEEVGQCRAELRDTNTCVGRSWGQRAGVPGCACRTPAHLCTRECTPRSARPARGCLVFRNGPPWAGKSGASVHCNPFCFANRKLRRGEKANSV